MIVCVKKLWRKNFVMFSLWEQQTKLRGITEPCVWVVSWSSLAAFYACKNRYSADSRGQPVTGMFPGGWHGGIWDGWPVALLWRSWEGWPGWTSSSSRFAHGTSCIWKLAQYNDKGLNLSWVPLRGPLILVTWFALRFMIVSWDENEKVSGLL